MATAEITQQWYVRVGDKAVGPFTDAQIRYGAVAGRIRPDMPVRRGVDGEWVSADRLSGLHFQPAIPADERKPPQVDNTTRFGQNGNGHSPKRPVISGIRPRILSEDDISQDFSEDIREHCATSDAPELSPNQRVIYAMVLQAFDDYRRVSNRPMPLVILALAGMLLLGCVGSIVVMEVLYGVLYSLGLSTLSFGLYVFALVAFITTYFVKRTLEAWPVQLERDQDHRIRGMGIGRLESILDRRGFYSITLFLGVLLGIEAGLIDCTPNHAGLEFPDRHTGAAASSKLGVDESIFWTFDNHLQNLMLTLSVPRNKRPELTPLSSMLLFYFRVSLEILLVVLVVWMVWRYRIRRFFHTFPSRHDSWEKLADWIEGLSRDGNRLSSRFHDEFIFIMLAEEYIRGNYDLVYEVSHQFPRINVSPEVEALFVDPSGALVFDNAR